MVAAAAILLIAVMMFGLSYLNVSRGNLGQKTAAEAAALAAAQDISRIVIDTPEFGFVSLCDFAPMQKGKTTLAKDNYFCEVRSINELMATARLNYIIASKLNDDFMKRMALQDRDNVLAAKKRLDDEIAKTLVAGGKAKDIFGNDVSTFDDAFSIYTKNLAKTSEYVPPTLTLKYGSLENGIATQVAIPNPSSEAGLNSTDSLGGNYVSDTNMEFQGEDFVFCSTGKQVSLCDPSKFTNSVSGLPYQMPAVVRIDADQKFYDQNRSYVQHFTACACAGSDVVHPMGGALTISFPDGPIDELTCPADLLEWDEMKKKKCDVLSADGGDFPVDLPLASIDTPKWDPLPAWTSDPPVAAETCRLGIYDWIRNAGSRVNITSVLNMLQSAGKGSSPAQFDDAPSPTVLWKAPDPMTLAPVSIGDIPAGILHIYSFSKDGSILYRSKSLKPYPYTAVGEKQLYAELADGEELNSKTKNWKITGIEMNLPDKGKSGSFTLKKIDFEGTNKFDFYERDLVRVRGYEAGGRHDGDTMECSTVAFDPFSKNMPGLLSSKKSERDILKKVEKLIAQAPRSRNYLTETYWRPHRFVYDYAENAEIGGQGKGKGKPVGGGGIGVPPTVSRQDDFATTTIPAPPFNDYKDGPAGGAPRPTYTQNGLAVELRFRRQTKVGELSILLGGFDVGYVGEMD